ncbi:MAG: peptide deformylase [Enterobacteriaceae bacterium]
MKILKILKYPDLRLKKIANKIKNIDKKIIQIIEYMFDTMYYFSGIGLAATQVNLNLRLIVIDIESNKKNKIILINPKIIKKSKKKVKIREGCLSVPNIYKKIKRSKKILIKNTDTNNKNIIIKADNLLSICIQHEIDHLNGKLIIDY